MNLQNSFVRPVFQQNNLVLSFSLVSTSFTLWGPSWRWWLQVFNFIILLKLSYFLELLLSHHITCRTTVTRGIIAFKILIVWAALGFLLLLVFIATTPFKSNYADQLIRDILDLIEAIHSTWLIWLDQKILVLRHRQLLLLNSKCTLLR